MAHSIRKTDPPSPHSAADSMSRSSSTAAARPYSGRFSGALVSQPHLLQFLLSIHNLPILYPKLPLPARRCSRARVLSRTSQPGQPPAQLDEPGRPPTPLEHT
jgi:hypothetical protein